MALTGINKAGFYNAVFSLAIKTIKLRYKNSVLGVFWSMLNPLFFMVIIYIVFGQVNSMERFALYALSGLIFWNFISGAILQVLTSFIDNADILKSINLHPLSFPLSAMLAAIFNLLLSLIPFTIVLFFLDYQLHISIIALFPYLFITAIFVAGLGMLLGTINVYFRDIQLLWSTITPAFFYFTPIAYSIDLVPERFHWLVRLNPFYHFIDAVHKIFYDSRFPTFTSFCIMSFYALFTFSLGYFVFKQLRKGFISNI